MHSQESPQTSVRSAVSPPMEDIEAVLGRFQAWTETHHRKPEPTRIRATQKARSAASPKSEETGLREISYEEALKVVRHRRPSPAEAVAAVTKEETASVPAAREAVPASVAQVGREESAPSKSVLSDFRQALAVSLTASVSAMQRSAPQPVTSLVIAAAVRPAILSVRFAVDEREQIRTRAAEAGLSISAYVRQCTLEVEQLRAQVKQMLEIAPLRTVGPAPAVLPVPGIQPGLWRWVRRRFSRKPTTGLALRA